MQPLPEIDLFKLVDQVFDKNPEFEDKSRSHQVFFLVWCLTGQVDNGGFAQFYFNISGNYANETVSALKELGSEDVADILTRSNELFGAVGPIRDYELRLSQMETLEDSIDGEWESLSSEFYEYSDDMEFLLKKYVAAHPKEFSLD